MACREILTKNPLPSFYDATRPPMIIRCGKCGEDAEITIEYKVQRKGTYITPSVRPLKN